MSGWRGQLLFVLGCEGLGCGCQMECCPSGSRRGAECVHTVPTCCQAQWGGCLCPGTARCPPQSRHPPSSLSGPLPPRPAARLPCAPVAELGGRRCQYPKAKSKAGLASDFPIFGRHGKSTEVQGGSTRQGDGSPRFTRTRIKQEPPQTAG